MSGSRLHKCLYPVSNTERWKTDYGRHQRQVNVRQILNIVRRSSHSVLTLLGIIWQIIISARPHQIIISDFLHSKRQHQAGPMTGLDAVPKSDSQALSSRYQNKNFLSPLIPWLCDPSLSSHDDLSIKNFPAKYLIESAQMWFWIFFTPLRWSLKMIEYQNIPNEGWEEKEWEEWVVKCENCCWGINVKVPVRKFCYLI